MRRVKMMTLNAAGIIKKFNDFVKDKNIIEVTSIPDSNAILIYWEE